MENSIFCAVRGDGSKIGDGLQGTSEVERNVSVLWAIFKKFTLPLKYALGFHTVLQIRLLELATL